MNLEVTEDERQFVLERRVQERARLTSQTHDETVDTLPPPPAQPGYRSMGFNVTFSGRVQGWGDLTRRPQSCPEQREYPSSPVHDEGRNEAWTVPFLRIGAFVLLICAIGGFVLSTQSPEEGAQAATAKTQTIATPIPTHAASHGSCAGYVVLCAPTITSASIDTVLCTHGSPACHTGQALYDLGVQYGIDPAFALAFFLHESSYGTQGEAQITHALGNIRCIPNHECRYTNDGGYTYYPTWVAGYQAWYDLIRNLYVGSWGLVTIDQIIPTYAPAADHNDEAAYIAAVETAVDGYRANGGVA